MGSSHQKPKFYVVGNEGMIPKKYQHPTELINLQILNAEPFARCQEKIIKEQENQQRDQRKVIKDGKYPYSAICLMNISFEKSYNETAFLISDNVALTAAHNVYNRMIKKFINSASLVLGISGRQGKQIKIRCFYVPNQFVDLQNDSKAYDHDYAMLILNTDECLGQSYGFLPLSSHSILKDEMVQIYGYPPDRSEKQFEEDCQKLWKDKKGDIPQKTNLFGCSGKIKTVNDNTIVHLVDTEKGQSGSPILYYSLIYDRYEVVGVHSRGFDTENIGVRMRKQMIDRMNQWLQDFSLSKKSKQRYDLTLQSNSVDDLFSAVLKTIQKNSSKLSETAVVDLKMIEKKDEETIFNSINDPDELYKIAKVEHFQKFDFRKALRFYRKALTIYERKQPQSMRKCGYVLHNMGIIHQKQGNNESALACYNRSLAIKEKEFGNNSADYANTLGNIGIVYYSQGNLQKARSLYNEALAIKQKIYGKEHIYLIEVINNIGAIEFKLNNYDESIKLYERALKIASKHYGANHIKYTPCLINLSQICRKKGNNLQAKQHLQRAMKIFESNKVQKHNDYAISSIIMGDILRDQENVIQAMEQWKKAKKMLEQILGPNNKNQNYKKVCEQIEKGI